MSKNINKKNFQINGLLNINKDLKNYPYRQVNYSIN